MGWEEIAGFRSTSRRSVVFIANDAPPRFVRSPRGPPTCISWARRCSGDDDRQNDGPEATNRGRYRDCTFARKYHPRGIAAWNAAYYRCFTSPDNRSNSRALSQERVFDRCLAHAPYSYQQCSGPSEQSRTSKSKEKVIPRGSPSSRELLGTLLLG